MASTIAPTTSCSTINRFTVSTFWVSGSAIVVVASGERTVIARHSTDAPLSEPTVTGFGSRTIGGSPWCRSGMACGPGTLARSGSASTLNGRSRTIAPPLVGSERMKKVMGACGVLEGIDRGGRSHATAASRSS
jgi:hypothetical protein